MSETVRARIAVAVDGDGNWNACGWDCCPSDARAAALALEGTGGMHERVFWVEVDLPIPTEITVKGTVTEEQP